MSFISSVILNNKFCALVREAITRQWHTWLIISSGMMFTGAVQAADLTVESGSGAHFWSTASGMIDTTRVGGGRGENWAFRWNIAAAGQSSPNSCNSTTGYIAQDIGPVRGGIKIAQGVVLYFTAGNLSSTISVTKNSSQQLLTTTANLTADGTMANLTGDYIANYKQVLCTTISYESPTGSTTKTALTGGSMSIYVDDTAVPGTYTVQAINLVLDISGAKTTQIAAGGTLTVIRKASCNVSVPAVVNFGTVSPGSIILTESGQIAVQCQDGDAASTPVNYRATPAAATSGATTYIPMLNQASKSEVGVIRAFLGTNGVTDAGCKDASSSMYMNGTSHLLTSVAKNGSSNVPVTWTLCPTANPEPGPATAALALEIDW